MFKSKPIAGLALLLIAGLAQAGAGGNAPGGPPGATGGRSGGIERLVQRLARAADELQISDQQMDQIYAVVDASRDQFRNLQRGLRDNRRALRASTQADPYDADAVAVLAAAKGELTAQSVMLGSGVRAQVRAILTPDQRSQIKQFRQGRRGWPGNS